MGSTEDQYVSGGVNWAAFTLEELVNMVADKASVPQLERLADDWRQTGDGVVAAADYLAEALDDLMYFWSGASADQARETVALNAQWVGDLGMTARDMGDPIDEAAGALRSAQEAMPQLPEVAPSELPGSATRGAAEASSVTDGSQLGAAVGATAAGSESAFQARADEEELKRVAIETMQRFEAAALGIDEATPQFQEQSTELRPREDDDTVEPTPTPGGDPWLGQVDAASSVDARWQLLTGMADTSSAGMRGGPLEAGVSTGVGGGSAGGGGGGVLSGPVAGRGTLGDVPERVGGVLGGRPISPSGAVPGGGSAHPGMAGPMGAPMAGAGAGGQADGQTHRRRVPYDGDDPFDTGEKVSNPVIGI